jgi:hypothetical protein
MQANVGDWLIVFPGPTDMVVSASAMAEADRRQNERIKQVQSAIAGGER